MKHFAILLILPFIFFNLTAQNKYVLKGDSFLSSLQYKEAIDNYKEGLKSKEVNQSEVHKKISKAYYALKNYELAKKWYDLYFAFPHEADAKTTLQYANLLRNFESYDSALIMYQKYGLASKDKINLDAFEKLCDFPYSKEAKEGCKAEVELTNLPIGIDNMGIAFIENGLMYSKPIKKREYERTVYYDLTTAATTDSINFEEDNKFYKKMNALYYDGAPYIYNNESKLIFTRNQETIKSFKANSKKNVLKESGGVNLLQLFYASISEKGKWNNSQIIVFEKPNYNYAFPFVDTINNVLYFSSDLEGGFGGFDIYSCDFKDGKVLSSPKNLGSKINSFDNDIYPYLNGDKLFYASKGKPGLGGYDLFLSNRIDSVSYEEATNLGNEINTSFDDFNLILSEKFIGYFASNRESKNGNDKIYKAKLSFMEVYEGIITDILTQENVFDVQVTLYEEVDGEWVVKKSFNTESNEIYKLELDPSKKNLVVYDHSKYYNDSLFFDGGTQKEKLNRTLTSIKSLSRRVIDKITRHPISGAGVSILYQGKIIKNIETDEKGVWTFMPEKNKNYTVRVNEDNYEELEIEIPEINYEMIELDIETLEMSPIARVGNVLKIDNIYFDFDKSNIKQESLEIMDNIYNYLVVNSAIKVELSAHTDCVGKDDYNLRLSSSRAKSCYEYLINKGIDKSRIIPKGYGEQKMVAPDCRRQRKDKAYAQRNRRVEVKILE